VQHGPLQRGFGEDFALHKIRLLQCKINVSHCASGLNDRTEISVRQAMLRAGRNTGLSPVRGNEAAWSNLLDGFKAAFFLGLKGADDEL